MASIELSVECSVVANAPEKSLASRSSDPDPPLPRHVERDRPAAHPPCDALSEPALQRRPLAARRDTHFLYSVRRQGGTPTFYTRYCQNRWVSCMSAEQEMPLSPSLSSAPRLRRNWPMLMRGGPRPSTPPGSTNGWTPMRLRRCCSAPFDHCIVAPQMEATGLQHLHLLQSDGYRSLMTAFQACD